MQRRQYDVQPREHRVGKVEPAVRQDVRLDPVQNREGREPLAQTLDLVALSRELIDRHRPRRAGADGMIRDRDVFVPQRGARGHHLRQRIAPVAERRVHVEVAPDVLARDERRHASLTAQFDLVRSRADLRRNEGQSRLTVDVRLGCRESRRRSLPDGGHVRGGAGCGEQHGPEFVARRDAHVHLREAEAHDEPPRRSLHHIRQFALSRERIDRSFGVRGARDDHQRRDERLETPDVTGRLDAVQLRARSEQWQQGFEEIPRAPERERGGPHPFREPGAGAVGCGAGLLSVGNFAATQSLMPPARTETR